MNLEYDVRPIKVWPADWKRGTPPTARSPFSASFSDTEDLLARELDHLHARGVVVQIDIEERMLRVDGTIRANAVASDPGVILSFTTQRFGALSYPCRAFTGRSVYRGFDRPAVRVAGWQANLRAIALGLEALRKVERYGIAERGQQYAGYAEIGSGIALGPAAMTEDEAWKVPCEGADVEINKSVLFDTEELFKAAAKRHHPDVGGEDDTFKRIVQARDVLVGAR